MTGPRPRVSPAARGFCAALLAVVWLVSGAAAEAQPEPSLTLEEAFRLAVRNNESFRITEEGVARARLLYDRALALLLPTLRVEGSLTAYDTEVSIPIGGRNIVLQQKNTFGGLGTFSMSLFDARALPGLRQTKTQIKSSEQTAAFVRADLLYEVGRTFLSVLAAQRLVEINRHAQSVNEEHLRDARARVAVGEAIKLQVTRAELEVVKAQREVTRATNALEAAWVTLRYLVGAPVGGRIARPTEPKLPAQPVPELVGVAQRGRRDLRAAREDVDSARKALDVAYGAYYPSLGLVASSRATQNTGLQGRILNSSTLFTLGWTLFDGGVRYADVKEKHSLLREAILKRSQLERQVEREVRAAQLELQNAEAALHSSRKERDLAQENHALVTARYRAGLATTIEAVDASTALAQAEVTVLREELNVDTQRVNVLRAVGADPLEALAGVPGGVTQLPVVRGPEPRLAAPIRPLHEPRLTAAPAAAGRRADTEGRDR